MAPSTIQSTASSPFQISWSLRYLLDFFFLKRCGCLHRALIWFIVIMNWFLVETSFPGATSVTDLFHRCPFACICWTAASKDPISEKKKSIIYPRGNKNKINCNQKGLSHPFKFYFPFEWCPTSIIGLNLNLVSMPLLEFEINNSLPKLWVTI